MLRFIVGLVIFWLIWSWLMRRLKTPVGAIVAVVVLTIGSFIWGVNTGNWYGFLVSLAIIAHFIKQCRDGVEEGRDMRKAYEEQEIDRIVQYERNQLDDEFIEEFGMNAFREYVGADVKGIYTDEGFIRRFGMDAYNRYVMSSKGLQGQRDMGKKQKLIDGVTDSRQEELRKKIELKNKRVVEYHQKRRSETQKMTNNSEPRKKSKKEHFIGEYGIDAYHKVINGFRNETYTQEDFVREFGADAYHKYNIGKMRRQV